MKQLESYHAMNTKKKVHFLRILFLLCRLLKDEWGLYIASGFDRGNNREYYRHGTYELINAICKRLKRSFDECGFTKAYMMLDEKSCDVADGDMVSVAVEQCKNKVKSNLFNRIPYNYIEPLTNIITAYMYAYTIADMHLQFNVKLMYADAMKVERIIEEYIDNMEIPRWQPLDEVVKQSYFEPLIMAISTSTKNYDN